jgi:hypothetical protein
MRFLAGPDGPAWMVLLSVVAAMAASLGLAAGGSAIWMRHPGSQDTVFADLMLWGWLRKYRAERRLAEARALLEDGSAAALEGADAETRRDLREKLSTALEARDAYARPLQTRDAPLGKDRPRAGSAAGAGGEGPHSRRCARPGKIKTPREVLTKPGRLDDAEFEIIKQLPVDGAGWCAISATPTSPRSCAITTSDSTALASPTARRR